MSSSEALIYPYWNVNTRQNVQQAGASRQL